MTQIQPNPRNVEEEAWLKLVWTACTLNAEMVKEAAPRTTYPLLLQRAVALVWVTGCRRSDEIRRLPLDCVRSEWAPEMVDEQGVQLEEAEYLWYLHVPSNKLAVKRDKLRKVNPERVRVSILWGESDRRLCTGSPTSLPADLATPPLSEQS